MSCVIIVGAVLGAYLLGSIPFGLLAGLVRGIDIRTTGSGNIGATNVARALGKKAAVLVFTLDVLKGFGPTLAGKLWLAETVATEAGLTETARALVTLCVAAATILGHMFPVYLRFRGGKGAATGLGMLLALNPPAAISALGVWMVVLGVWGYVSLASMVAACSYPVLFLAASSLSQRGMGGCWLVWGFITVLCGLVVLRHRGNISRLLAGTESKIGIARAGTSPKAAGLSGHSA